MEGMIAGATIGPVGGAGWSVPRSIGTACTLRLFHLAYILGCWWGGPVPPNPTVGHGLLGSGCPLSYPSRDGRIVGV